MRRVDFPETVRAHRVESVLSEADLERALTAGRKARYRPVDKGNGKVLYVAPVPEFVNRTLHQAMEFALGRRLLEIASFYRLNSGELDVDFRVHCDSIIQGQRPTHACVFYLEDCDRSGTALFTHPEHGLEDPDQLSVFDEDDGKWEAYLKNYAKANSMFVYDSALYHARFPWVSKGHTRRDGRIVVVKFMRDIT